MTQTASVLRSSNDRTEGRIQKLMTEEDEAMSGKLNQWVFTGLGAMLTALTLSACVEQSENVKEDVAEKVDAIREDIEAVIRDAELKVEEAAASTLECEETLHYSVRHGEGHGIPGVAGAERWGIPDAAPAKMRVRRSYATLSDAEKKRLADAFVQLKQATVTSEASWAQRADYETFCEDGYTRNLYDYYVELHFSAFVSMGKDDMPETREAHMGPQFLPWHRYYLLRLEADMREILADPDFALPYWDWEDCEAGNEDGSNPCPKIFDTNFLGSHGSCEDGQKDVTGYLVDQGFETNLWSQGTFETVFNIDSLRCSTKPLQRAVGCSETTDGAPPSAEDAAGVFDRHIYDVESYDTCDTDENVSMRQYLEGYSRSEERALCIIVGCQTHGLGHLYIGGDMASGGMPPNDPMFFLHHTNVDRLWAMWQDRNREKPATAVDYGNPGYPDDWRGEIFNFDQVRADETFNFRALGYRYDTNSKD